jgi:hypothetical protein
MNVRLHKKDEQTIMVLPDDKREVEVETYAPTIQIMSADYFLMVFFCYRRF